jgi:hypothetical protein
MAADGRGVGLSGSAVALPVEGTESSARALRRDRRCVARGSVLCSTWTSLYLPRLGVIGWVSNTTNSKFGRHLKAPSVTTTSKHWSSNFHTLLGSAWYNYPKQR